MVDRKLALRVAAAAVERAPPPALALDHLALVALGTREPDLLRLFLLDVLAVGVVAAGDEGAEPPPTPHEVVPALWAFLVDRLQLLDLELAALPANETTRLLALGVS